MYMNTLFMYIASRGLQFALFLFGLELWFLRESRAADLIRKVPLVHRLLLKFPSRTQGRHSQPGSLVR